MKITLGGGLTDKGSYNLSCTKEQNLPTNKSKVIDISGGNEVFTAAFASKYRENGGKINDCLKFANSAALIAASRLGSGEDCVPSLSSISAPTSLPKEIICTEKNNEAEVDKENIPEQNLQLQKGRKVNRSMLNLTVKRAEIVG
jgi:bifunctional ADP-heptose synthase (sugar kinase/adenylyltransferase)